VLTILLTVVVNAAALAAATWLIEGISVGGATRTDQAVTLLVVAVIFGLVNSVVRPLVRTLALPLYLLTLGLITFVINALMLLLSAWLARQLGFDFDVDGFWAAVVGALLISVVSFLLHALLPKV
jgi:putative membrane protein